MQWHALVKVRWVGLHAGEGILPNVSVKGFRGKEEGGIRDDFWVDGGIVYLWDNVSTRSQQTGFRHIAT